MKRILSLALLLLCGLSYLLAEERENLGALELDTEYRLLDFKNYIGTYTATVSGVLTCEATTNDVMYPYREELDDMETEGNRYEVSMNRLYGGRSYDFNVEAGKTYVMYAPFIMNSNTVFKMSMASKAEIKLTASSPAEGATFQVSNGGQISLDFDKAVSYKSATLSVGSISQSISGNVSTSGILFDVKNLVWEWLTTGQAKAGDQLTLTLEGVCQASNAEVLYEGTGHLELHLVLGKMPIVLQSAEHTTGSFLSYYTKTDERGIVRLHFSGKVSSERLSAQLKYGEIEKDAEGDYYVEFLEPTISEDGTTVIVNLQGKRRKAQDMTTSGTNYGRVVLGITGVLDEEGNYAFASGQGSLGSYWYAFDFQEINANIFCEFTPGTGATLTEQTKSIELWVTDEQKLSYDGVCFSYEKDGTQKECLIKKDQLTREADPDDNTATILTIPVPAEVLGAESVVLTLANLECADGGDYSAVLTATYKTSLPDAIKKITIDGSNLSQQSTNTYTINGQHALPTYHGVIITNKRKVLNVK